MTLQRGWPVLPALCILIVGCGKEPVVAPPPTQPSAATKAAPAATVTVTLKDLDGVAKSEKPFKIALIVKTRNNPFFKPMIDNFEQTVKDLGCVPVVEAPPKESDSEQQVGYVQDEVAQGISAICIAPADSRAIVPCLKAAVAKGVVVINLDNRVSDITARAQGLVLAGYVGADNTDGGQLAGKAMVEALGKNGVAVIIGGLPDADNGKDRVRGFTIATKGALQVIAKEDGDWDTEKAYSKTVNLLAAHPNIRGIFCANDKMALGAIRAIDQSPRKGKVTVVGYDNIAEAQPLLASGKLYATIEQHPELMGKYGARMAVGILEKSVPNGGEILVPIETMHKK